MKRLMTAKSVSALIDDFETQIPKLLSEQKIPGLSISVIQDARILWSKGFGIQSSLTQEKVTTETLFEACSLSKPVFAYAILRLVTQNKLSLDESLMKFLPEPFTADEPDLALITARHVLSHTTGFPNWRPQGERLKIHFKPGSRYSYSGEGFMYLQAVVEQIVGQDLSEFLRTEFLQPMGMTHSCFTWDENSTAPIAVGHDNEGKAMEKRPWILCAAASLHSTPDDFARFMCAVMRPDNQNPIHLSEAITREILTPQIPVNDSPPWEEGWPKAVYKIDPYLSWGLGWGLQKTPAGHAIFHWGNNGNYRAFVIGDLDNANGIVMMTNGENGKHVIPIIMKDIVGGDFPCLE